VNALAANGLINAGFCDKAGNVYAGGSFTNSSFNNYLAEFQNNTDIRQSTITAGLNIFPNPSIGNFKITFPDISINGSVEIDNVTGETIFSENVHHVSITDIRLTNIPTGIYFVKVLDDGKQYFRKIIVQQP
jgi:hypothetical protein